MNKIFATCAAGLSVLYLNVSSAQAQTPACPVYKDFAKFDYPLRRIALDMAQGKSVRIVALGSSSTEGYGASDESFSYPAQLQNQLRARFPKSDITVINRGRGGDMTRQMAERLEEQVLKEKPQMVLLQAGANEVLKDGSIAEAEQILTDMMIRIRSAGIDVVLVDNQYSPKMNDRAGAAPMQMVLENASHEFGVPMMRRGELMKRWHEKDRITLDDMLLHDGYHMKNWSYECFAKTFAVAISGTIQQLPTLTYHMK